MKENTLKYWMVETSVEVMNSLFMQTYEQRAVLSHTDYLLDAEKVWSDLVAKLSYCWFSTDFEHSTPRLGGLGETSWWSWASVCSLSSCWAQYSAPTYRQTDSR